MFNATPFLKLYAKRRLKKLSYTTASDLQLKELFWLLNKASSTKFGVDHGFQRIKRLEDFQRNVPLRKYEDFWEGYWKGEFPILQDNSWPGKIPFFAVSSGTSSGTTKYIPYSNEMTRSNKIGGLDLLSFHLANKPDSQIFGGKCFIMGGSTDFVKEAEDVYSGDLSGIAVHTLPWWARRQYFPPRELALLSDWEEKIEVFTRESLKADIRMISGVPSWLLIFFETLFSLHPEREPLIKNFYPDLEMLTYGGVSFKPYEKRFRELLEGTNVDLREVYPASEGFVAVADRGPGDGLRMILDSGIFYEFVPLEELGSKNPTRHWIGNIEEEINYAVVISSCAGLFAYILGDTVRFIDTKTPRLHITGRTSYYLSAFGEHLIAEEIDDAVTRASLKIGISVSDYSVGPLYPDSESILGGHLFIVEFDERMPSQGEIRDFEGELVRVLCERNEDYRAHYAKGFGLRPPEVRAVKHGFFSAWMASRGKLGGQNKVPRIITDEGLLSLLSFPF